MEEARGDSMKDYFLFSIFRVVSGAKPTEVVWETIFYFPSDEPAEPTEVHKQSIHWVGI